ncbi:transcription factor bHLH68-like [Pyrus communis]|uniref:transcription factor bHLH68-like n=1 Tax=Pyrus communis TaxID=23211 RepID=UPI0035C07BCF
MAEECGVAISSSSARLTQQNWWDLVSSTNPWQQQLNQKYSNSSNNCDDLDQDVSNSSTSFTNASNHSSFSVDSSRIMLVDQRSASSNDDLINGEQVSENHIWNHVLLNANANHDLSDDDHGVGENFLDALSSKSLSTHHVMYNEPACEDLKKLDNNSTWEFINSAASNFNNFEKQINGGFMDNNMNISIEKERLTKMSNQVSTWSIATPEPQVVLNNMPPHQIMDQDNKLCSTILHHDRQYSQPNLCHLKPQPFFNDSTSSCNPQMGITNRNSGSSLFSCYSSQIMKVDDQNHGHHNGIEHQIGLNNAMAAYNHTSKYFNGNGSLLSDSYYSSSTSTTAARNLADVGSFTSQLGNKPLIDLHAPKSCFKSFNSSDHSKKQTLQTSSSTRMSSGRGQGIANEGKKKRTDDTSSETVVKKPKQETSTGSSTKIQAPKVKLTDRITALQPIVSPFGKTDTASVLYEAIQYIKFMQDQVHMLLNSPYLKTNSPKDPWTMDRKDYKGDTKVDLKSKGLCLVPVSCTPQVYRENTGSDHWTPTYRGCLYR